MIKKFILIIFLPIISYGQKEIVVSVKDKADEKGIKALENIEKGTDLILKDKKGNNINLIIKKVVDEPSPDDIRDLTPRMEKSIEILEKYNEDKIEVLVLKEKNKVLKQQLIAQKKLVKELKAEQIKKNQIISRNNTQLSAAKKKIQIQKSICINEISELSNLELKSYNSKYLMLLKKRAENLELSKTSIKRLNDFITYANELIDAKKLVNFKYNSGSINTKLTSLALLRTEKYPGLNKDNEVISNRLKNYCSYNNRLLKDIQNAKKIPDSEIREDNLKNKYSYKKIREYEYTYLIKQARQFLKTGSFDLSLENCK